MHLLQLSLYLVSLLPPLAALRAPSFARITTRTSVADQGGPEILSDQQA